MKLQKFRVVDRYGSPSVEVTEPSIVSELADIGSNVKIGPFCFIEAGTVIPDGTEIPPCSHLYPGKPEVVAKVMPAPQLVARNKGGRPRKVA